MRSPLPLRKKTGSEVYAIAERCVSSRCEGWKDAGEQNDKLSVAIAKLERYEEALKSLHRMAVTKPAWCGSSNILDVTTKCLSEEEQKEALEKIR